MTNHLDAIREHVESGRAFTSDSKALLAEVDHLHGIIDALASDAVLVAAEADRDRLRARIEEHRAEIPSQFRDTEAQDAADERLWAALQDNEGADRG